MKKFEEVETTVKMLDAITCDCCKIEYLEKDVFEMEEFLSVSRINAYGSIFGDGSILELDLCQHCIKKVLGEYLRIEEGNT